MPTTPSPETLRRQLTENRYRLTDYGVRQHPSGDNWWVTLCGDPCIGPCDSERQAWQALERLLEDAERRREIRNSPYNQPRKTV